MTDLFRANARLIILLYILFSSAWVYLSAQALSFLLSDSKWLLVAHSLTGWLWVMITAVFFYNLIGAKVDEIKGVSLVDELTNLPNRNAFRQQLELFCERQEYFSVSILDIDNFAAINDSSGHGAGDRLVARLAELFAFTLPDDWYIARIGGDEFAFISPSGMQKSDSITHLKPLMSVVQKEHLDVAYAHVITCSIGVAEYGVHGNNSTDLMRSADAALTHIKRNGKNQLYYFHKELAEELNDYLILLKALKEACQNDDFALVYQPQWSVKSHAWEGVEVLIRWHHPQLGFVPPDKFIPIAEKEGLIGDITNFVVRQMCCEFAQHEISADKLKTVSINFSHSLVSNHKAMQEINTCLDDCAFNLPVVLMEITETAAMKALNETRQLIERWRNAGIQTSIDDFGTGYASLSRIKQLNVDEVKIDKSFVQGLPDNQSDIAITKAVLAMADSMGLMAVAEGVETKQQAEFLSQQGCDILQGYWLSRPVPIEQLNLVIANPPSL